MDLSLSVTYTLVFHLTIKARCTNLRVGSYPSKYATRAEVTDSHCHTSLLHYKINYICKKVLKYMPLEDKRSKRRVDQTNWALQHLSRERGVVPAKPFQPSEMFVGNARSIS